MTDVSHESDSAMQAADQYYKLAKACRHWAVTAEHDGTRRVFLQWAQQWTDIALRLDGLQQTENKAAVDQAK